MNIKRYILSILITFLLLITSQCPCLGASTNQISQFGITWTFDRQYEYGRFANGDYWVVGPVTVININPASSEAGGRVINGSMINPSPRLGSTQGYDSSMFGVYGPNYNAGLNAARPGNRALSSSNPLIVQPSSSLVSTISMPDAGHRPQLKTAAVLTVLQASPPAGSFRPPYVNVSKGIRFNKSQLDYSKLLRLAPAGNVPRLKQNAGDSQSASVERMFERPWLDHIPEWMNRYHHPADNLPDYGREISTQVGIAALMLNLNYSNDEKETLLIRFVQLGIDLYGIVQDGGEDNWVNNGGHASGRKFPILFAGVMLNDYGMRSIGQRSGDYLYASGHGPGNEPPDYVHFGEDDQTFFVTQLEINISHSAAWDPDDRADELIPYSQGDIGLPEWGIREASYPEANNKYWGAGYRRCCTAISWAGFTLAARAMGLKALWNHEALFDYMDRYMQVTAEGGVCPGYRQSSRFVENMWDTYRADYGQIWIMGDPYGGYSNVYDINEGGGGGTAYIPGDVSGNGEVSSYDASLAAQYAISMIALDPEQVQAADVSGNSEVSAYDASLIAQYAIGLIDHF